jgi:hypothetical protein
MIEFTAHATVRRDLPGASPQLQHANERYVRGLADEPSRDLERLFGDLISYQNGGKGWLVIPDEIERTVSEYASQRIDIRAGNALISRNVGRVSGGAADPACLMAVCLG